jgi:transporter family protein
MKFPDWIFFALGSAFFAGATAVLGKIGVKDVPSNLATLLRVLIIAPFLAAVVWVRGDWRPVSSLPLRSLAFLVLSGLATGLSWMCYYRALQTGPASLVAPIDKLSLPIAVLLAFFFLGETMSQRQWTGAVLMVAGALIVALK